MRLALALLLLLVIASVTRAADITLTDSDWTSGTVALTNGNNYTWDSGSSYLSVSHTGALLTGAGTWTLTVTGTGGITHSGGTDRRLDFQSATTGTITGLRTNGCRVRVNQASAAITMLDCRLSLTDLNEHVVRVQNGTFTAKRSGFYSTTTAAPTVYDTGGGDGITLESCVVISTKHDAVQITAGAGALSVTNCYLLGGDGSGDNALQVGYASGGGATTLTNTILQSQAEVALNATDAAYAGLTDSHNWFDRTDGTGNVITYGGTSYAEASVTSFEANSHAGTPSFVAGDATLTGDYTAVSGDQIDGGVDTYVTSATDYSGADDREQGSAPDIGPEESAGSGGDPEGACCTDEVCSISTDLDCAGTYQGDGTDCDPDPCAAGDPTGSCCASDGGCTVTTEGDCEDDWTEGGVCSPNPCAQPGDSGACCVSAGLGNQGTCTVTSEAACTTGFWFDGEACAPNPCPTAGDLVNAYDIRQEHPRLFLTPEHVTRLRELYNDGDIDPSVPQEIQDLWESVVGDAYNDTSWGILSSQLHVGHFYSLALVGAAYVLTGDQVLADSASAGFEYIAANTYNTVEDDRHMQALDVMWDALDPAVRTAAARKAANTWTKSSGGNRVLSFDRRGSASMNLFGNETYWCLPWAVIYWGAELTTEHGWISDILDEGYSRMMGASPPDEENGFYSWVRRHWPTMMGYPKGPSYGAKYMGEAFYPYALMMKNSGLSDAPADSIAPSIRNGSYYQMRLTRPDGNYIKGFAGSNTGPADRDWAIAAFSSLLEANEYSAWVLRDSRDWTSSSQDYLRGAAAMLSFPDSIATVVDLDTLPLVTFSGKEGLDRPKNEDAWYDQIVARWGAHPWEQSAGNAGMLHTEAGVIHRDNYAHGRQLRLSVYHDGAVIGTGGSYDDGGDSYSHYDYYYTSGWNSPTIVVHDSFDDDTWADAGPTFLYRADIVANPTTDWVDDGTYDQADLYACGTADVGDSYALYGGGVINPTGAYQNNTEWDVVSQGRRFLALLPGRTNGRALVLCRDEVSRSAAAANEGIWSNFPVIHEPTAVGGSVAATHDVAGVTANIIDYDSPTYFAVNRDTLSYSAQGRLYPIGGVDYARKIWGYGIEWWQYRDVTDPATGEMETFSATFRTNRFTSREHGGGRLELHAADGANSADITWLLETHAQDTEPTPVWATIGAVTSSDVVGVVADSVVLVIPDDPDSGGPWAFSFAGADKDVVIAGLPDGGYELDGILAVSSDSLVVFPDVDGAALTLASSSEIGGACCYTDGTCAVTLENECEGTYQGDGTDCDPNPCPQPTGSCCAADGSCTVTEEGECADTWTEWEVCSPNPCDQPDGACCAPDGTCTVSTDAECTTGDWQGYGTDCDPNLCPVPEGACCVVDGHACTIETEADCDTAGGEYRGDGTVCSPDPCPLYGSCCLEDGTCSVRRQSGCLSIGGLWTYAEDCTPDPCDAPEACCTEGKGTCFLVAPWACPGYGGAAQGEGTDCDPDPCTVAPGACCTDAGGGVFVCGQETEADCQDLGGIFMGYVECSPDPCEETTVGPRQRSAIWRILTGR